MSTTTTTTDDVHDYTPESALAWVASVNDSMSDVADMMLAGYLGKVHRQLEDPTTGKPFGSFVKMAEACLIGRGLRMSKAQWQWFATETRGKLDGKEIALVCGVSAATISRYFTFLDTGEKPTANGVKSRKDGKPGAGADAPETTDTDAPETEPEPVESPESLAESIRRDALKLAHLGEFALLDALLEDLRLAHAAAFIHV